MTNSTFGSDENFQFNACVGNNGWVDLSTYSCGFDEAVSILSIAAMQGNVAIDALIYPIVFSARHRIELFIKSELKMVGTIRESLKIPDNKIAITHDLKTLWDMLESSYAKCDRRYAPLAAYCREIIFNFHEIDPKGETFRYPYSQDGIKHLTKQSVIGLQKFIVSYRKLTNKMQEIEQLSIFLRNEYSTGTHTEFLSRKNLEDIAKELPSRDAWIKEDGGFNAIRDAHIVRYNLSKRKYSEALTLIQNHREFSSAIGKEIAITYCDAKKLQRLFDLNLASSKSHPSLDSEEPSPPLPEGQLTRRKEYQAFLEKELSDEELATVMALFELGKPEHYSESFDYIFRANLKQVKSHKPSQAAYLSTKAYLVENIMRSLNKLGQVTLLSELAR